MDLTGVLRSQKTPVKKSTSKTKDTICLSCGICLIGERCTFNVQQQSGLRQKLESILEETVDCNVYSSRVCRPCGRRIKSLNKKYQVVMEQIRKLRGKYYLACRKSTITVKRMSKSNPFCRESALSISTLQALIPILSKELI